MPSSAKDDRIRSSCSASLHASNKPSPWASRVRKARCAPSTVGRPLDALTNSGFCDFTLCDGKGSRTWRFRPCRRLRRTRWFKSTRPVLAVVGGALSQDLTPCLCSRWLARRPCNDSKKKTPPQRQQKSNDSKIINILTVSKTHLGFDDDYKKTLFACSGCVVRHVLKFECQLEVR